MLLPHMEWKVGNQEILLEENMGGSEDFVPNTIQTEAGGSENLVPYEDILQTAVEGVDAFINNDVVDSEAES